MDRGTFIGEGPAGVTPRERQAAAAGNGRYVSWGRYPSAAPASVIRPAWRDQIDGRLLREHAPILAYGLGRSYGDSCLNDGGALLDCRGLDRVLAFDTGSGAIVCEAGVSLAEILALAVPRGWFLPVTPGTKFVTVGGAIASDVHGKNHHVAGTIGCHIRGLELLRSSGEHVVCSREENSELFGATIGGLGLTGVILWAEMQLKPITCSQIAMEIVPFHCFEEFISLCAEDADWEYTVAWLDCLSGRDPRGIFMRAHHAQEGRELTPHAGKARLSIPFTLPESTLNPLTIRAFNTIYYAAQRLRCGCSQVHYDPFFYPLDRVGHWNRIYGARGLTQYQCVIPDAEAAAFQDILDLISEAGQGSFLGVMKRFGSVPSPGMLSFPRPGLTLALDFPFRGKKTLDLFAALDGIVFQAHGALYPAKDARMDAAMFRASYPRLEEFRRYHDPALSSSFWRRVAA